MPDNEDAHGSERFGWDMAEGEPLESKYRWVNHPFVTYLVVLGLIAILILVALFITRNELRTCFGGGGPDGCGPLGSVSNAPGS